MRSPTAARRAAPHLTGNHSARLPVASAKPYPQIARQRQVLVVRWGDNRGLSRELAPKKGAAMAFQDIQVIDVRVTPQTPTNTFQFQFQLSRVPERFWPECFSNAYNARSGLKRIELSEDTARITLPEDDAENYIEVVGEVVKQANAAYVAELSRQVTARQRQLDEDQQRQARAEALQQKAKQILGIYGG